MGVATGLPLVPAASCPSVAGAIASAGLGPICSAASGVSGAAGSAASSVASGIAGFGASAVLDALGSWVSSGAVWLLSQIGAVLSATTSIDLGASWFSAHYSTMAALAGVVIVPLLLLGIMQSIYRQSAAGLLRSVLVNVPLAILLTAVAVKLVQVGLSVTDAMSSVVSQGAGLDSGHFMGSVIADLSGTSGDPSGAVPAFVLFVGSIAVVVGAVLVWIELLIRSAAVYVAVLFLPLALASLAWPAISHWCRRLVDTLVALVLGKFVIVAVLSLAAGALAGGSRTGGSGSGGFASVLGGAALLLLAAFAPWALFRLLPFVESGAVGHLEGLGRRAARQAYVPARRLAEVAMAAPVASSVASSMAAGGDSGILGGGRVGASASTPGAARRGDGGGGPRTPLAGPSMAETTGVGSTSRPGAGIPMWEPNAAATAAARKIPYSHGYREFVVPPTGPGAPGLAEPSSPDTDVAGHPLQTLPRQTGALVADSIGHDHLGVKLVSRRLDPDEIVEIEGRPALPPPDAGGERG